MADEEVKPYPKPLQFQAVPIDGGNLSLQLIRRCPTLTFMPCGLRIDLETGEVVIPEGLSLTDAAKAFWDAVQHVGGYRKPGFW